MEPSPLKSLVRMAIHMRTTKVWWSEVPDFVLLALSTIKNGYVRGGRVRHLRGARS